MRAVVQRVLSASVTVDSQTVSEISRGLMVLVGIGLKIFSNSSESMWKASIKDIQGDILCVSQFTLMANTSKGNKPDFHRAMSADQSRSVYTSFLQYLGSQYSPEKIKDGRFGAMMNVTLTNEGPVTFTLDSRKFEYIPSSTPTKVVAPSGGPLAKSHDEAEAPDTTSHTPTV
ncbi:D-tyrosyl-tRNA deacylase [Lactifluus volemus]|nr:D-tyrosyl-tRNA deacylase [Lactifluus volemus]